MESIPKFSLATVDVDGVEQTAIVVSDKFYLLDNAIMTYDSKIQLPRTIIGLLKTWQESLKDLSAIVAYMIAGELRIEALKDYSILTPIRFPNKLIAVGANYYKHLREMGLPVEKMEPMPYFFRPPSTSLVGPGPNVRKPRSSQQLDWELELVLVLGKSLRHASSLNEAQEAIAGYIVGLDLSCRDLQMVKNLGMDVGRGKAQDTLAPCGPFFEPKHNLPQGVNTLTLNLWVNGQQMVTANTNDMIFSPEEMLVEMSRYMTLEPGDMVFTGAPPGTAKAHDNRWLQVGDTIKAEIEGVGVLEIGIVEDI